MSFRAASTSAAETAAARRAYLNGKFGRTGNLDADINARGIENAIRVNAQRGADFARIDEGLGAISGPQAFGTRAHQYFERFNNRLANRSAGTYDVATEQYRNPFGGIVWPRSPQSIGADVLYKSWESTGAATIYDLKTFSTVPRAIRPGRQNDFLRRFGAQAQEIYVPQ